MCKMTFLLINPRLGNVTLTFNISFIHVFLKSLYYINKFSVVHLRTQPQIIEETLPCSIKNTIFAPNMHYLKFLCTYILLFQQNICTYIRRSTAQFFIFRMLIFCVYKPLEAYHHICTPKKCSPEDIRPKRLAFPVTFRQPKHLRDFSWIFSLCCNFSYNMSSIASIHQC